MTSMWTKTVAAVLCAAIPCAAVGCSGGQGQSRSAVGAVGGGSATVPQLAVRSFETLELGTQSGIDTAEDGLYVEETAFLAMWNRHAQGQPAPRVDFTKSAVITTFRGWKPVLGYGTEIVRVDEDARTGNVHVIARDFDPGSWRIGATALSYPYHMVTTPPVRRGARVVVTRQQKLDFEELLAGAHSPIGAADPTYPGELMVFRSQADFASFWALHSQDPVPQIAWGREMVVAVLAGFIGSFGNSVETKAITADPAAGELRLDHVVHGYRGGAAPPQVDETPFQVLRVTHAAGTLRAEVRQAMAAPSSLATGDNANYTSADPSIVVVRDQATYDRMIQTIVPGGPKPLFDFTRVQVVFAFLGTKPSTAWGIAVQSGEMLEDGELELRVTYHAPLGRPMGTPTSPYEIAVVARTYGPVTPVFVDTTPRP